MVGTSGALRLLYETEQPQPRPGLFLYRLDERRVLEGGALSDGGNLYAWLEKTLADGDGLGPRPRARRARPHVPAVSRRRAVDRLGSRTRRARSPGSPSTRRRSTSAQAALEGVAFRFAAIADLLPELEEVVATGGALLADPEWIQVMADALARPVTASGVEEASLRGAAVAILERLGYEAAAGAPRGRVPSAGGEGRGISFGAGTAAASLRGASWRRQTDIEQRSIDTHQHACDGRGPAGERRASRHRDGARAARVPPLHGGDGPQPRESALARPRPVRPLRRPRVHPPVRDAASRRLQPLARGAQALPAVGVAHPWPSRGPSHARASRRPPARSARASRTASASRSPSASSPSGTTGRTTRSSTIASTRSAPTAT